MSLGAILEDGTPSFPATAVIGERMFDIKKVKKLCNPMDKTAAQSPRETSATSTASSATTPRSLLCYQSRLARKLNHANTASLANAGVGDDIEPAQANHKKRGIKTGDPVHTAPGNLFPNPALVDTSIHGLVCFPTNVASIAPVVP